MSKTETGMTIRSTQVRGIDRQGDQTYLLTFESPTSPSTDAFRSPYVKEILVGGPQGGAAPSGFYTTSFVNNASLPLSPANGGTGQSSLPLTVAHGGTGQSSYTDGQLLIGNSSTGGLTKATLTAGTSITITNGNGSITISSSGGSGGGMTFLSRGTANNTATHLDFPSVFTSSYDTYMIDFGALLPATNGVTIYVRITTDNGSTYDSTSGHYEWARRWNGTTISDQGTSQSGDSGMQLWNADLSNSASFGGMCGQAWLMNVNSSSANKSMLARVTGENTSNRFYGVDWIGLAKVTTAFTGFQVITSTGNLTSGTVTVYGIKNS